MKTQRVNLKKLIEVYKGAKLPTRELTFNKQINVTMQAEHQGCA